ncbi:ATP-binding cassette domain-containing protein [Micromonospora endolithica]|uniref:ATP-binding cassette domain-containing protein n=1 Tax=Micromonospora endolithica TaxID=230091 RepID=A0A3A9Z2A2_9ACTN|nr:ATP-binding cassette domain-containing protein [Micromonospora endolithica]RKN41546.1 ATP-binding cassette domain-containing protein [Micromonospora endolithica]TWJ21825.1 ABC-2 type transport system ATP-binding protein [Micromonospora endolithica]
MIEADGLRRRFGATVALAGLDLRVPPGSVCGLLGANGAGKTTAVRILTTLLRADAGRARVAGFDVGRQPDRVRARIGLVGQHAAVDEVLSGRQNLVLFGRLHHLDAARARRVAAGLLDRFGLAEAADRPAGTYSGGMRRRLDLAAGLVHDPPVLFLDEPTTGLDPRARAEVWDYVRELSAAGTTVLLTTQYLEEADQLADRLAVVAAGRVVAAGTPDELKAALRGDRVDVALARAADLDAAARVAGAAAGAAAAVDAATLRVSVPVQDRVGALAAILPALADAGIAATDVVLRRPTLDEVFLRLTGAERGEVAA